MSRGQGEVSRLRGRWFWLTSLGSPLRRSAEGRSVREDVVYQVYNSCDIRIAVALGISHLNWLRRSPRLEDIIYQIDHV